MSILIVLGVFLLAACWLAVLAWVVSREVREIEARMDKGAAGPYCTPSMTAAERSFLLSMLSGKR